MAPTGDAVDDDDYVAALLKRDAARRFDPKYQLIPGATSTFSRSQNTRGSNGPKPNTRFLQNIIRDTDQHNAMLKAREVSESRARLQSLESSSHSHAAEKHAGGSSKSHRSERKGRWSSAFLGLGEDVKNSSKQKEGSRGKRGRVADLSPIRRGRVEDEEGSRRHRHRRSPTLERTPQSSIGNRRRQRSVSDRSASPRRTSRRHEGAYRSPRHDRRRNRSRSPDRHSRSSEDEIGPQPPSSVRTRGRGHASSNDIESHFESEYDPRLDIGRDEIDDDFGDPESSLEASRDRALWRKIGADRLRAAGFTPEQIAQWEKGESKDVDDVKWRSKNDIREWDRGKEVSSSGDVELKASWIKAKKT